MISANVKKGLKSLQSPGNLVIKPMAGTLHKPFALRCLCATALLLLASGCAGMGDREAEPAYVPPNLPSDQLALVFIEDDKDNFIFVELDAVATIEKANGLVVDAKEVMLPPGRHRIDIEVDYPWRGLGDLIDFVAGIAALIADGDDEDEEEDEEEEPRRPSRYDKDLLVNVRSGHRYQIKYDEDLRYSAYGDEEEYKLDVWVEDVTYKTER